MYAHYLSNAVDWNSSENRAKIRVPIINEQKEKYYFNLIAEISTESTKFLGFQSKKELSVNKNKRLT